MRQRMRTRNILVSLVFLLQACSMNDLLPATRTPQPTSTPFITLTPIDTPTQSRTPRPTPSATIVKIPTQDPNQPTFTPFALPPIIIDGNTTTPVFSPTPSRPGPGFFSVTISPIRIYWGGCTPNSSTVLAVVDDPDEVFSVLLFTRVKDLHEEDYTPWTKGTVMFDLGDGSFTHTLVGSQIYGHNHYKDSSVFIQLVATNLKGEEVGRTKIYENAITMSPCMCYEPLKGCIPTFKP